MIIVDNDDKEITKLRKELSIRFEMKDLGEHHFIGLEVQNVKDDIFSHQESYVKKTINRKIWLEWKQEVLHPTWC